MISATVTIVSLVLSIFGSSWLNQRNNERLIESLRGEIKAEFQSVRAEFQSVRAEMKTIETKIDAIDTRVSRIERQLEQLFKPILK